ncbi:MAG: proline--tRNA ligase [Methanofollis liminatans]|uniref:Proline--tRNA ligase n=1 Tax=Methanofollis liminatans DSM 4140 TaxID=28892 RepID=J1L472_9EURY|nr:proline--tRNA ligase [Methanofollis liminatans]EJG07877.1 Prolyl-tRNA synthetase [Methanofollis liminatans DSM 4140]MDD3111268.1 proline--tRNA ligase [Methanofollis liminatans]
MEDESGSLPPKSDFSAWYNDVLWRAEIMDVRYPVKGLYVWFPFGFGLRRHTYTILRGLLDGSGHDETLFPLLIPKTEFMKEAEHIKGFEEEVYWVTHGGLTELDVPLALRPTSETAMYPMFALWVRSHADLPIKIYQIVNTFRYETKHTRPLIRLREITSFKEAHTAHATWDEAAAQVETALSLYTQFYDDLCIPVIISRRPDWDKFPGADYTMAVDALMPDGRTLQVGTAHHLGTHFSKTFNITYEDATGEQQFVSQTCYGISERCIAAAIGVHGDDRGLVLPPKVAPVQVVIIPIIMKKQAEEVRAAAEALKAELEATGLRVKVDDRELRPGAKYYHWEMRGVPLRIEVGPRDLAAGTVVAATRDGEKMTLLRAGLAGEIPSVLAAFAGRLREQAEASLTSRIVQAESVDAAVEATKTGIAVVNWCGDEACAEAIEKETNASVLGTEVRNAHIGKSEGACIVCGRPGTSTVIARTY